MAVNLYRHFGNNGTVHSTTDAFLLALPSYFVYRTSVEKWTSNFESGFGQLMKEISGNDANAFSTRFFTRSSVLAFDSPQVWNPMVGYDAQAAVVYNDEAMIVCFRGSESPLSYNGFRDWFGTNLTFQLRTAPDSWGRGVRVHRGFYVTLNSLYGDIHMYVRRLRRRRRIYLTGHSTGAALATLCAYRFRQVDNIDVEAVYTFGSPRVGNNGFAQAYAELLGRRTFRWVNHLDLAAQVPDISAPPTPTAGPVPIEPYVHVGRLNYIEGNGSVTHDLLDHDPMTGGFQLLETYKDHDMRGYLYRMFDSLSNAQRVSPASPAVLVRDDVKLTKLALAKNRTLMQVVGPQP
jgi:pimeloyl-ACP methyl ester carboxylesterase